MNRPYVICHMLQSIDGKIAGGFFREKETTKLAKIYSEISTNYDGDAIIYGKTTALELFSLTHLNKSSNITYNLTDHVYQKENKKWLVVIDLKGEIAWDSSIYKNRRLQDKNLIVILSEAISNQYLELLKKLNIDTQKITKNYCAKTKKLYICTRNNCSLNKGEIPKWPTGADCNSADIVFVGSNPALPTYSRK